MNSIRQSLLVWVLHPEKRLNLTYKSHQGELVQRLMIHRILMTVTHQAAQVLHRHLVPAMDRPATQDLLMLLVQLLPQVQIPQATLLLFQNRILLHLTHLSFQIKTTLQHFQILNFLNQIFQRKTS
jgi:hypothetical protein